MIYFGMENNLTVIVYCLSDVISDGKIAIYKWPRYGFSFVLVHDTKRYSYHLHLKNHLIKFILTNILCKNIEI